MPNEELKILIDTKADGKEMSIVNLDGGGAIEQFDLALKDVVENCNDVNRELRFKREVNLKLTLVPVNEGRTFVRVKYRVDTKLAQRVPLMEEAEYRLAVDGSTGAFLRSEAHEEQGKLFDIDKRRS